MTKISVIIPTFRRPEGLRRALASVLAQESAPDFEIVVVDNAPEGGARDSVADLSPGAAPDLVFVHEPRPGVATARNTGWRAAHGGRIAFLDDDEEASPRWLRALDDAATLLEADAVWGPIQAAPPPGGWTAHARFLSDFFGRAGPETTREVETYWGCGNSLVDRDRAGLTAPPFDPAQDELGGEDDRLFSAMRARGARFGWAHAALVSEHVPASRANLSYVLSRSFAFGQGPSQTAAERKRWHALIGWMLVGAGQALVYGAVAAVLWIARAPARARFAGRAAQGLGKLFWFDAFAPRLYGAALSKPEGDQTSSATSGAASSGAEAAITSAARAGASGRTDSA